MYPVLTLYLATREVGTSGTSASVCGSASLDDGGCGEGEDVEFNAGDILATVDRLLTDAIDYTRSTLRRSAA